jgi:Flp pilus assembly protein TadD
VAREAAELTEGADYLMQMGEAWADLGYVLGLARRKDEARDALRKALELFEAKGALVGAANVRRDLVTLS